MKIQEFRDKMKQGKREDIEKIAAELYKMLPKYIKEADADPVIEEIMSGGAASASGKKKESVIDFDTLKIKSRHFCNMLTTDITMSQTELYQRQSAQSGGLRSSISSR